MACSVKFYSDTKCLYLSSIPFILHLCCSVQFDADVLACSLTADSSVEVLDTWNVGSEARNNVVDTVQDVFLFSGNLTDGRISCT